MTARVLPTVGGAVLADPERAGDQAGQLADPSWWADLADGAPLGGGRGGVRVTDVGADQWVLRHYRRGGMIGRLVHDAYLWTGLERTRAFREWRLLDTLVRRDLPVPLPIAARVIRRGLVYRADLVTVRIPGSTSLSTRLAAIPAPAIPWTDIGGTVARFHDAGVWHADLNAHNILLDDSGRVFVLDFDRGRLRGGSDWREANLARLRRSLDKIGAGAGRPLYGDADWQALLAGYSAA